MSATEAVKKLPGVTLRLRGSKKYRLANQDKADVQLVCDIDDVAVWEQVLKLLSDPDGYRIYTQEDFKGEMLNVFRSETLQLEKKNEELRFDRDRLQYENKILNERLQNYQEMINGFGRNLNGLP